MQCATGRKIDAAAGTPLKIAEQLDAMRSDFPQCRSLTFADLASGLVLYASTVKKMPQERLDAMSDRARALLEGPAAAAAERALGSRPSAAVWSGGDSLFIFVRSPVLPDEALCCECSAEIEVTAFTERAARELAALGTAGA